MSDNLTYSLPLLKLGNNHSYEVLYREYYPSVEKFIIKNSGTIDDARDVFQDTLLVLLQKLKSDNFELTASLKTYIIAISKNLWFKKLRNVSYFREIEITENLSGKFYTDISSSIDKEKTYWEKLQIYMDKTTAHCNYLLRSLFFQNRNMEAVQKEFGYTSLHNAQNQKHKCLSQLRKVKSEQEFSEA